MPLPRQRTVEIRKVPYRVRRVRGLDCCGECDCPTDEMPEIRIEANLDGRLLLNTLAHEVAHACLWDIGEEAIEEIGDALERVLWEFGYRNIHTDL